MQEPLERLLRHGIREHAAAHRVPVHGAAGADEGVAEQALDVRQCRAARLGQLARDGIGVDYGCAAPREFVRRRALAAADAPGQPDDEFHSLSVYQRMSGSPQYRAINAAMAM